MSNDIIRHHLAAAVRDGIALGLQMAVDCLSTAKPHVANENQTWDSAMAALSLVKADYEKRAAEMEPLNDR